MIRWKSWKHKRMNSDFLNIYYGVSTQVTLHDQVVKLQMFSS